MSHIKPVLFLDFDGLKFDTLDVHVRYINKRYNIQTTHTEYVNNPSLDVLIKKHLPDEQRHLIDREDVYLDIGENLNASHDWHADVPPIEGMTEIIPRLAKKYTLWTVTARQKSSLPVIQRMLDTYVPDCISGIHCVWEHLGNKKFAGISKQEFITSFTGTKVGFIDDSVEEIKKIRGIVPTYLFDPHGRNDSVQDIENRVRSWQEIGTIFL